MLTAGVLVVSDRGWHGERSDVSGQVAQDCLSRLSIDITKYEIIPDERSVISSKLMEWVDDDGLDFIVTSGGTGLSPRDVTPEATLDVVDKGVPGLAEAMRMITMKSKPEAMLSRAVAGSRGKCLIVNLPGSPVAVKECLDVILPVLPHALEVLGGKIFEGEHHGSG